jgi:hypothetical protein
VVDENLITATGLRRQRSNPNRAFAAGLLTGREEASLDAAMAAATVGYAAFAEIKPFWYNSAAQRKQTSSDWSRVN